MPGHSEIPLIVLMSAYARSGHMLLAKRIFDNSNEKSAIAFNAPLSGFASNSQLLEAKSVFDSIQERNQSSWSAMLSAYTQNGHLDMANRIFLTMPDKDLIPWDAMLAAYSWIGAILRALDALQTMVTTNTPDEASLTALLTLCAHKGTVAIARDLFVSFQFDHSIKPSKQHYSCMIGVLVRSKMLRIFCGRCHTTQIPWIGSACLEL
ncbi:pentatricopeptide repeat-containing protein At4g02750-like [Selaginella moellendorffii]|uniref:pentatricopeptide repeat-containing protein At4g02750-like n=1 Tax=Selaginella moellendorffii TaxID=88036 RepID=UPI000D1C53B4|nr:pentatricopeptide repeat-containing protein At4g02750-like [Selaginella moellendorffii]|eukprot:XP_024530169.1 pentatricopeptide repeat-containing protein At4g02750-like [Selaginella moellendorffii]